MPATFTFVPGVGFSDEPGYSIDLRSSGLKPFPLIPDANVTSTSTFDPLAEPTRTTKYEVFNYDFFGSFLVERDGTSNFIGGAWHANYVERFIETSSVVRRVLPNSFNIFDGHYKIDLGRNVSYASVQNLKIGHLVNAGDNIVGSERADTLRTTDVWENVKAGAGNDLIDARAGNDKVLGGAGNDRIWGGIGNDTITGESGADTLYGGTGTDRFVYTNRTHSTAAAMDTIVDFDKSGNDVIDLAGIYGPKLAFIKGAAFSKIGQVRINDIAGADVIVEANVAGSLAADFAIRIKATTLASMTPGDFIL